MSHSLKIITTSLLLTFATLTGCVYKIDLPQGTPISASKVRAVQIGMTPEQVLYVLGSPAIKDPLAPNRWDYLYDYTAGTDGKRKKKSDIKNASQYISIHFGADGRVVAIDGTQNLPAETMHK